MNTLIQRGLLLGLRLVLTAAKQEAGNHVPHQMLVAEGNHVEVSLTEVGSVCQHSSE